MAFLQIITLLSAMWKKVLGTSGFSSNSCKLDYPPNARSYTENIMIMAAVREEEPL